MSVSEQTCPPRAPQCLGNAVSFAPVEKYLLRGSWKVEVGTTEKSFPKSTIMEVTMVLFLSPSLDTVQQSHPLVGIVASTCGH